MRAAYLPSITSESVRLAVEADPSRFHVASAQGVWATEEILERLVAQCVGYGGEGSPTPGGPGAAAAANDASNIVSSGGAAVHGRGAASAGKGPAAAAGA